MARRVKNTRESYVGRSKVVHGSPETGKQIVSLAKQRRKPGVWVIKSDGYSEWTETTKKKKSPRR